MTNGASRVALVPGYRLHEYQLEGVLGHGGFGITYLATDTNLHKRVAIKEYLPGEVAVRLDGSTVAAKSEADEETFRWGLTRFAQEAQTLARFRHPNIIQINRYFEGNGTAYFVMDYEDGQSLKSILDAAGTLSQSELEEITYPLLDGLEQVHAAGVLHRDIKPGNIYIRRDGSPVLLDFGAARQALGAKSHSLTSIFTPGYAPYEQYYTGGDQGPWTDIYAMAAVLYRGVTSKAPPESPARVRSDPLVSAVEAGKGRYDPAFLVAIDAGLGVYPEDRPQSIDVWREVFLAVAPPVPKERAGRPRRPEGATPVPKRAPEPAPQPQPHGKPAPAPAAQPAGLGARAARPPAPPRTGGGSWVRWALAGGSGVLALAAVAGALIVSGVFDGNNSGAGGGGTTSVAGTGSSGTTGIGAGGTGSGTTGAPITAAVDPPAQPCDTFAGDPWDPAHKGAGIHFAKISSEALARCGDAVKAFPTAPRMMALYGRALFKAGRSGEGATWSRRAAEAGSASGAFQIGAAQLYGVGVAKDTAAAQRWLAAAAAKKHAMALYMLGAIEVEAGGSATQGAAHIKAAAEAGVVNAEYRMGALYASGTGVPQNAAQAVRWYRRAAEHGHAPAEAALGRAYIAGRGVAKDYKEGNTWLRKAAVMGEGSALHHLGRAYFYAYGVPKSYATAAAYFRLAAMHGYGPGRTALGVAYFYGRGVKRDRAAAVTWFRRAAAQGQAGAQSWLGYCYLEGFGVKRAAAEAYFWLGLAVKRGSKTAAKRRDKAAGLISAAERRRQDARIAAWRPAE